MHVGRSGASGSDGAQRWLSEDASHATTASASGSFPLSSRRVRWVSVSVGLYMMLSKRVMKHVALFPGPAALSCSPSQSSQPGGFTRRRSPSGFKLGETASCSMFRMGLSGPGAQMRIRSSLCSVAHG